MHGKDIVSPPSCAPSRLRPVTHIRSVDKKQQKLVIMATPLERTKKVISE